MLRAENYYYVDKTHFIPIVEEEGGFLFFTRPRRFGKSLWISMLAAYYDSYYKDRFEQLFGDLWIGSHKTSQQGRYQVLTLDFSNVGGGPDELKNSFNKHACFRLNDFMRKYRSSYPADVVEELELNHGFCDFFLLSDLSRYPNTSHSYIIELKFLPKKDWTETVAAAQWEAAVSQIMSYAAAPRVEALRQGTALHLAVVQFCGGNVERIEEV